MYDNGLKYLILLYPYYCILSFTHSILLSEGMPEFTDQAAAIMSPPGREGRVTGLPLHGHGQGVQDAP